VYPSISRRELLGSAAAAAAALVLVPRLDRFIPLEDPDHARLGAWAKVLREEGLSSPDLPLGPSAVRVGELAIGTPYQPFTLESYLRAGGRPSEEPLTLSLTRFDCVTLVEGCLAVARVATGRATPSWRAFGREVERMRYRGGVRRGYSSRLHYLSEWITDGASRGLLRDLGPELGGRDDDRPLRFMTEHRRSYPALADEAVFQGIAAMERGLDGRPRRVIPCKQIPQVVDRIQTGDVLAFATAIPGLDVTHTAFAYRDWSGVLRVLHAPLSGGVVEITRTTLPEYVAAIRRATGILVARPLPG
jgi:Protein of unknown function (DUF1460)